PATIDLPPLPTGAPPFFNRRSCVRKVDRTGSPLRTTLFPRPGSGMQPARSFRNHEPSEACMTTPAEQLEQRLKQQKITEVECLISDLTGIARGKISPTNKFLGEGGMRLPESVLLQTVTGDFVDDDVYYDLLDEADIDMVCRPDPNAVFLVPWALEPTAMVIHDSFDRYGNPIELS